MNASVVEFTQQEYRSLDEIEQRAVRVLAGRGKCRVEEEGVKVAK